jgi:hypothetical protein
MSGGGDLLERRLHRRRQAVQRLQLLLVGGELRAIGELLVNQQVGNFLELALLRDVEDIVAAVVKVVAAAPDGAQRRAAGLDAGEGNGFLGLEITWRLPLIADVNREDA